MVSIHPHLAEEKGRHTEKAVPYSTQSTYDVTGLISSETGSAQGCERGPEMAKGYGEKGSFPGRDERAGR